MVKEEIPVIFTFSTIVFQPFQNKDVVKKVDIHVFSAVEKYFSDMLSLENIISDIVPNVSNKQERIWYKSLQWL